MKPTVLIAAAGLILLAGLAIGWQVKPMPDPTYRTVTVTDTLIQNSAPDTILKFVDRIVWRVAEPTVVARGGSADLGRLEDYCRAATIPIGIIPDSVPPPVVLPPTSGRYAKGTLDLYATTSDGRLFHQATPVTAPFEWVATGDTYEVREHRKGFQFLSGIPKVALPFLAGLATGVILAK